MIKRYLIGVTAFILAVTLVTQINTPVKADEFDDRIRAVQREIDQYQTETEKLKDKAQSLERELSQLASQKQAIQSEINLAQLKHDKLKVQIQETQTRIADNKNALGSIIAQMYVDDSISPLEMLASSKNIGDFIDKNTYSTSISETLQKTIDTINNLRKELEVQQADVKRVLGEQELAKKALSDKETEQQTVLNKTRGDEAAYKVLTAEREEQKGELHRQQQAVIEAASRRGGFSSSFIGDSSKGGYPWEAGCQVDANAWSHGGPNGNGTDPLGYGCRQCVSYTAFKVGQRTGNYPRYWGNANQWPGSARASGYATGNAPRANSVGIIMAGQYGHSVWIDEVNADGSLIVSQYNYYNAGGPGWGNYSKMRVSAATYDVFIYL